MNLFESTAWHPWFTAGIVVLMVIALVKEVARPDLVLLGCLGLLLVAGVLPPEAAFAGFSNSAVLTIAALFVAAAGVERTQGLAFLDRLLFTRSSSLSSTLWRLMVPTAVFSAFLNNTPLVAMLLPRLKSWAHREGIAASKVMIPLSYGTILGGMTTLLGTSTNLVVSGLLLEMTGRGLHLFDQTPVGLPAAIAALAYFCLIGHRLLPQRPGSAQAFDEALHDYHFELRVSTRSPIIGRTIEEAGLRALHEAYLTHVRRGGHLVGPVGPHELLQAGDVLAFTGNAAVLDQLLQRPGLERVVRGLHANGQHRLPLFEAVVSKTSSLVGKTLHEAQFRDRFQGVVLAVQRRNEAITGPLGSLPLKAGDLLLIEARPGFDERWNASREDFYLVAARRPALPVPPTHKAPLALALFATMVLVSALNLIPLVTASFAAALLMIALGCLRLAEARQAVDVPVLLIIAAAFGIGSALDRSGLATLLAHNVVDSTAPLGPLAVLAAIYLATNVATELLTNAAAAALVFPIAMAAAADLQLDALPFAVVVAIGASASFTTPFGYQTNLMVMSAGGYRFTDYVKAGLPVNLIVAAVTVFATWLVWL